MRWTWSGPAGPIERSGGGGGGGGESLARISGPGGPAHAGRSSRAERSAGFRAGPRPCTGQTGGGPMPRAAVPRTALRSIFWSPASPLGLAKACAHLFSWPGFWRAGWIFLNGIPRSCRKMQAKNSSVVRFGCSGICFFMQRLQSQALAPAPLPAPCRSAFPAPPPPRAAPTPPRCRRRCRRPAPGRSPSRPRRSRPDRAR